MMTDKEIYQYQRSIAMRYQILTPISENPTPTAIYEGLLSEYGLMYLPQVIMDDLESQWQIECTLRLTGQALLARSNALHRVNQ